MAAAEALKIEVSMTEGAASAAVVRFAPFEGLPVGRPLSHSREQRRKEMEFEPAKGDEKGKEKGPSLVVSFSHKSQVTIRLRRLWFVIPRPMGKLILSYGLRGSAP